MREGYIADGVGLLNPDLYWNENSLCLRCEGALSEDDKNYCPDCAAWLDEAIQDIV